MKTKYSNKFLIETGMGLQDVDKLKNSSYFINETNRYIKGEITLDELDKIITSYYKSKPNEDDRTQEADKVSLKIAQNIDNEGFTFSVPQLLAIHKSLFGEFYKEAGKIRKYNFYKREWVLNLDTVTYADYHEIEDLLAYDLNEERKFNYKGLSIDKVIEHLADFISNIWQIHAFCEGNTRTVAVFIIKYLRTLGFNVSNDAFSKNSWYFRNSLVRANYASIYIGVYEDKSFLIKFLRNLLLNETNPLKNRELLIDPKPQPHIMLINKNDRVLELIENNPKISCNELSNELKVSIRTVKNILKSLQDNKKIRRVDGKKFGHWEILK